MLKLKSKGIIPNVSEYQFIADSDEDVSELPKEDIPIGSTCYVISSGKILISNSKCEWIQV